MAVRAPAHDVVVIGSGAGGAAAAWRLCEKGLNVLLLEAGPAFNPARDYKLNQNDWERHLFPEPPGSRMEVAMGELGALDSRDVDLRSWNRATGPLVRGDRRQAAGPGYWHVAGVGGSTLHFVGESHRMHPEAMRMRTRFGVAADWPLTYEDLEPYYVLCEQLVGVAGPAQQSGRWRSQPYPLPAHPLSPPALRLQAAGSRLGMRWEANSRAALSQTYDGRPACNYCGNCSRGCPIGDKGSADVTFIRKAQATGRLKLQTDSPVVRLHTAPNGRIESVSVVRNGRMHRVPTPALVLAAGAVQTPRLLLASASLHWRQGLSNSSGQVGRNFMETLFWSSAGIVPELANSHAGLPSDAICWDFNAPDSIPSVAGGCRFNSNTQEIGFTGPISYATRLIGGFGAELKAGVRSSFGRALSVGALGEFLPNDNSFVDLHPTQHDSRGVPLARVHSELGDTNTRRLRFMASKARQLLRETGASEPLEEFSAWDQFSATHVFGTCRMGQHAKDSVVNEQGRSHDHANLFIADASVFPSSGGGESPALTIHALAVRTADALASKG